MVSESLFVGPYCCICFKYINDSTAAFYDGALWDICIPCYLEEFEILQRMFNQGCEAFDD